MKDILCVVGTRPNFIKLSPICNAFQTARELPFKIVHTGQHYDRDLSDVFFRELDIPEPDFQLGVGSGLHGAQTGKIMIGLERLCIDQDFSSILVIGDVNSTLAGAIVGAKLNLPVIHIESGLRSHNRYMPEEINRIATDHISDLLFAPTALAMDNLEQEGLKSRSYQSGDVMYDVILKWMRLAEEKSNILGEFNLRPKDYYLATLHRPYNVDDPIQLREIFRGLGNIDRSILLSAHPRLRKNLAKYEIRVADNIKMTQPLGYLDFINLEKNALKIITDSGGVQKEAFFVQTPCVTLRPETEWIETLSTGANLLVPVRTSNRIVEAVFAEMTPSYQLRPFGNGDASEKITQVIRREI